MVSKRNLKIIQRLKRDRTYSRKILRSNRKGINKSGIRATIAMYTYEIRNLKSKKRKRR